MADYLNLDFDLIKNDIKDYIKTNAPTLNDYNYEGSAISSMINVMSYVTQYNMHYLNMVTNELAMSTAKKKNSVLRLANMLNYVPQRNISAKCKINLTNTSPTTRFIYFGNTFYINEIMFTYTGSPVSIEYNETKEITIACGEIMDKVWISDGRPYQVYNLPDRETVDDDLLFVGVGLTTLDLDYTWKNVNKVSPTINGQFYYIDHLEELGIKFDDGGLYQIPLSNELVVIRYLKTEGSYYNGLADVGVEVNTQVENLSGVVTEAVAGGVDAEDIEQIRNRAVLTFTTQNRAITRQDYETLFLKYSGYSTVQDYAVFGGEEVFIDIDGYEVESEVSVTWADVGYVYFSILKQQLTNIYDFQYLTDEEKLDIETFFLPYKIITMFFKFVDPIIVYVKPNFRLKLTSYVGVELDELETTIDNLLYDTYSGMNKKFSMSNVINLVDDLSAIDYCEMEYTLRAKVRNTTPDYKVAPLGNKISKLSGNYAKITYSDFDLTIGCYFTYDGYEYKVVDIFEDDSDVYCSYIADEGATTITATLELDTYNEIGTLLGTTTIVTNNTLYTDTITSDSIIYVNDGTTTYEVGSINCDTGFCIFDNLTSTLLYDMTTFSLDILLQDDISFMVSRELYLCTENITVEYI